MIHCQQEDDDFLWKEQHLYGSRRLGLLSLQQNLTSITEQQPSTKGQLIRGRKHYELSNHLGNVLAVVNDRKQPVPQSSASHMIIMSLLFCLLRITILLAWKCRVG